MFGAIYALLAYGLVLAYRASGVLNFAQGALGMFFAFVYYQLVQGGRLNLVVMTYDQSWRLPRVLALALVVLVVAPAMGWLLEGGTAPGASPPATRTAPAASSNGLVTFPQARTYHRTACILGSGKDALPVTPAKLHRLSACTLCSPEPSAAAPAASRRRQPLRAT